MVTLHAWFDPQTKMLVSQNKQHHRKVLFIDVVKNGDSLLHRAVHSGGGEAGGGGQLLC